MHRFKTCSRCYEAKPADDFYFQNRERKTLSSWCKSCSRAHNKEHRTKNRDKIKERNNKWREDNPDKVKVIERNSHFKKAYGISAKERDEMAALQGNICSICELPPVGRSGKDKLVVDHDHKTGKIRSMICNKCNTAVGMLDDRPEVALRIYEYLTAHKETV